MLRVLQSIFKPIKDGSPPQTPQSMTKIIVPKPEVEKIEYNPQLIEDDYGYLGKPYRGHRDYYASVLEKCRLFYPDLFYLLRGTSRETQHVIRLLCRISQPEIYFGNAYLKYILAPEKPNYPDYVRFEVTASGEGFNTCMFWTFAPYIFAHLVNKGIDEANAMKIIVEWGKTGSVGNRSAHMVEKRILLRGLEKFTRKPNCDPAHWTLKENPNHITHLYTSQEEAEIADMLIKEHNSEAPS